jgi:hypothetical protein
MDTVKEKRVTPRARFLERMKSRERLLAKGTAREQLIARLQTRLDVMQAYLEDDDIWFEKLQDARLKEIVQAENLYVETLQLLSGRATQIIGVQQQVKMDQLLPVLQQVLQQRGLTIDATATPVPEPVVVHPEPLACSPLTPSPN